MAVFFRCLKNVLETSIISSKPSQWLMQFPTNHMQWRGMARVKVKRRKTHPFTWWGQKRAARMHQELTEENKEFVKDYIKEEFPVSSTGLSPLKEPPWPRGEWEPNSRRTGVIARKIGIYPMWTKDGKKLLTTVLQVMDNHVIRYIPPEKFVLDKFGQKYKGRFGCTVVGAGASDPSLFTPGYNGLFTEAGVQTKRKLTKFLVTPNAAIQPGTPLFATHFRVGDYVDVYGKTVGHGFQGVVKRWGMKGGPATHGTTKWHRRVGNIGGGGDAARVWPGKKLPGHMGQERRYLRGLKIWRINTRHNVIYVHGPAVPGYVHSYCYILDTVLPHRKYKEPPPFPTLYQDDITEPLPEEYYDEKLHQFSDPTITFPEEEPTSSKKVVRSKGKN